MLQLIEYLYTNYLHIVVAVIILFGIYYLFKKPLYTYYIAVFTLPFKSLYFWTNTNFEIWKILSAMALIILGPKLIQKSYKLTKTNRLFMLLFLYLLYAIFLTFVFSLLISPEQKHDVLGGFFKNEGRAIYQIGFLLITVNLVLWPIYVIKKEEEIFRIFKIVIYSTLVLTILGIMQGISVNFFNFNPLPIHRTFGFDYEGGLYTVQGGQRIHRISSLAGEPKHLAISLVIGIVVIFLFMLNKKKVTNHDFIILILFLISLIATYSGTGYVWCTVAILVILLIYGLKVPKKLFTIIVGGCMAIASVQYMSHSYSMLGIVRTIDRIALEVQDTAVFDFFKDEPYYAITGLGLGNIHYYAVDYLPSYFPLYRDTPFKGNSGFFLLLGDVGFIGLLILALFTIGLIIWNKRLSILLNGSLQIRDKILIHFTILASVMFLLRYFELFFVILGMMLYLNNKYLTLIKPARGVSTRFPEHH